MPIKILTGMRRMGHYKIVYDLERCIGVFACVAAHDKRWKMGENELQGKAVLEGGMQDKKTGFFEAEFDEDELQLNLNAARTCPTNVIHIIDKETGKQLI